MAAALGPRGPEPVALASHSRNGFRARVAEGAGRCRARFGSPRPAAGASAAARSANRPLQLGRAGCSRTIQAISSHQATRGRSRKPVARKNTAGSAVGAQDRVGRARSCRGSRRRTSARRDGRAAPRAPPAARRPRRSARAASRNRSWRSKSSAVALHSRGSWTPVAGPPDAVVAQDEHPAPHRDRGPAVPRRRTARAPLADPLTAAHGPPPDGFPRLAAWGLCSLPRGQPVHPGAARRRTPRPPHAGPRRRRAVVAAARPRRNGGGRPARARREARRSMLVGACVSSRSSCSTSRWRSRRGCPWHGSSTRTSPGGRRVVATAPARGRLARRAPGRARGVRRAAGREDRTAMLALGLLLVWLTLSVAWASDRSLAWTQAKAWYVAAAGFFLVANAMASPRNVRMLALAFVTGALVSIVVGLTGHGGLTTTADALDLATRQRFSGGAGRPQLPRRRPRGGDRAGRRAAAVGPRPDRQARTGRRDRGASPRPSRPPSRVAGCVGALAASSPPCVLARRQRLQAAASGSS